MIRFTSRFASLALIAALATCIGPVPPARSQTGVQQTISQTWRTYKAAVSFTPATTANADFLTITGPSTANSFARVSRISCFGTSTAAALVNVSAIKRSAVPSVAGTSTSPTAVPVDTSFNTAAGAVVRAYTVAPTPGAAVGTVSIKPMFSTVVGTPAQTYTADFEFNRRPGEAQGVILRSATQVLALNATMPAGETTTCEVTWMEQP